MKKLFSIDKIFIHLFRINALYAYPTYTSRIYKKDKYRNNPTAIYRDLYRSMFIFSSLAMLLIYSLFFFPIDFKNMPVMFDATLAFLIILNVSQTFTYCFNVFYESRDSEAYMPYPISEKMVFLAKMAVVSVSTIQLAVPVIPLVTIFHIKNGNNPVLALIFGLVSFVIFAVLIVAIDMLMVKILAKTAVLSRFKTWVITVISTLSTILNVVFILAIQNYSRSKVISGMLKTEETFFSRLAKSVEGQSFILLVVLFIASIIMYIALKDVGQGFYSNIRNIQGKDGSRKKALNKRENIKDETISKDKSTKGKFSLFKYNRSLLNDSTIIVQTVIMPALMPIIVTIPMIMSSKNEISAFINENQFTTIIVFSIMIGLMVSIFPNNLSSIIVSLDRENINYIKALPVDMSKYMNTKLIFSAIFSLIVPILYIIGISFVFKINIFITIISLIILFATVVFTSLHWMIFDYKHLVTNWQNTSDLFSRIPKLVAITMVFALMFIIMSFVAIISFISIFNGTMPSILILGLLGLWIVISTLRYRNFIRKI